MQKHVYLSFRRSVGGRISSLCAQEKKYNIQCTHYICPVHWIYIRCTLDLYVLHVGTISPTTSHSWCLSRWLIVHSFLYSDEDSEWQLRLIPNTYYSPSFTVWAFASPMTFAISSRDASLIRFTLLNSFNRAVLVFSPMPFIVSRADATTYYEKISN